MRIVIAGGTGFLGSPLVSALRSDGHAVTVLTRRSAPLRDGEALWLPDGTAGPWARIVDGADIVVNLSGASIAGWLWTASRKRLLLQSRVLSTRSLVRAVERARQPPAVFLSGSAVGIYGPHGDEPVTESDRPGADVLGRLAHAWESEAAPLGAAGVRLVWLRTGLALAPDGGLLERISIPFRLGVGGPLGNGRQYMPWIHRQDWVDLVRWLMTTDQAAGAVNLTAPEPVTNNEFSATLARVLRRPNLFRAPSIALRLLLGELSQALLDGQRAVPAKALALGFQFRWPTLEEALRDLLTV
jgi:uncharacterized protein